MPNRPQATLHHLPKRHVATATLRQAIRQTPELGIWTLQGVLCELRGVLLDLDAEIRALRHTCEETLPIPEAGDQTARDRPLLDTAAASAERTSPD